MILPDITVEAGLISDNPSQAGTSLKLGDATLGKLGTGTLGTSITWTDISDYVNTFASNRPATRLQGPLFNFQPGTITVLIDNSDGLFDPDNPSSPFTGQLLPMVPVRLRATYGGKSYSLYFGFADGWIPSEVTYQGDYAELTLDATDAFKVLAGINLAEITPTGAGADTGARVADILSRAGWYTSAEWQNIDVGNSTLQATILGADALSLMQLAVDSELGQLFVNGDGAIVFRARRSMLTDTNSNTVQGVFGDLPGTSHPAGVELDCAAIKRASDDTTIVNDVQATRDLGVMQEVKDTASIAKYLFPRTYSRSDLLLQNDPVTLNWAQWVLYIGRDAENRFESISIDPQADPANLWPQVLGREIGDRIQIWTRPKALPAAITKDCFIVGISHTFDAINSKWLTTWTLQDASKFGSFLTLGNATLGKLGSNALAF
jgi:hypothetical protein